MVLFSVGSTKEYSMAQLWAGADFISVQLGLQNDGLVPPLNLSPLLKSSLSFSYWLFSRISAKFYRSLAR